MARKVVFLTSNPSIKGGTNRVMFDLIRGLVNDFDIILLAFDGKDFAYPCPPSVRFHSAQGGEERAGTQSQRMMNTLRILPRMTKFLRVEKPDMVLSFTVRPNIANVLLRSGFGLAYRCVIAERNYNSHQYRQALPGRLMLWLMRQTYPRADLVLANAEELARDLQHNFRVPAARIAVLYNPFDLTALVHRSQEPVEHAWFREPIPIFINVARLIDQKNQAMLLSAFALVRQQKPCRLLLLGDGPLFSSLTSRINESGFANEVSILGWQDNPLKYISRSTGFVLSSNYEGFPSVLVEAMACGCPVISTDCPSGPREILLDGDCGLLSPVGEPAALADNMLKLLNEQDLRVRLPEKARTRIQDFEQSKVISQLSRLLGK